MISPERAYLELCRDYPEVITEIKRHLRAGRSPQQIGQLMPPSDTRGEVEGALELCESAAHHLVDNRHLCVDDLD